MALCAAGAAGVDLEVVEERPASWVRQSFSEAERALIEAVIEAPEADEESLPVEVRRARWFTRAWCAKEARAKAERIALEHPRRWVIGERAGARFRVAEQWVETRTRESLAWAWCLSASGESPPTL